MKTMIRLYEKVRDFIIRHRGVFEILIHAFQAISANYLAFVLRFESLLSFEYRNYFLSYLPLLILIRVTFYLRHGLNRGLWRYSSVSDLLRIIRSITFGSIIFLLAVRYLFGNTSYPRSVYVLDWLLLIMFSGGTRLFIRVYREYLQSETSGKKVLLIGAGDAGEMIVRDMKNNPKYNYEPIGFIDDDVYKKGLSIHGIPIFGPKDMMKEVIERHEPEEILICMPSMQPKVIREFFELCKPLSIPIKTLPGMNDILDGTVSVSQIKPLSLEDLLEREPVKRDVQSIKLFIEGKSVMVTGAGGSIGTELCRQIFAYRPARLIMLDRYENGLFHIDLELRTTAAMQDGAADKGQTGLSTVVGDICDRMRLDEVFRKFRPQIVFHAAAHKHVPLMEHNPLEAVKNNILGTKNLLDAAAEHGTESFVMISTDKAVNPTSVMGATKRTAEYLTMRMNHSSSCRFTTVRFGNVLGSSGSVVRVFREQLKRGGPLTVTHPEIKRYFMLIPEAIQLVLIAASSGTGGEIFILDMGEQVKILDLAENVIRLSGFIPYEDIGIVFTGLRPGEKMYEELFDSSEKAIPASHEKLKTAVLDGVPSREELAALVAKLKRTVEENSADGAIALLMAIVPNFRRDRPGV
jgi:FlaA1/EpsC-like NDP-sugar epimerase